MKGGRGGEEGGAGDHFDPPEKTTLKMPSLNRVKKCFLPFEN